MRLGESTALHCILFGHQHRQVIAKGKVRGRESVMIGKRMRNHLEALRNETVKKALRMANSSYRMYACAGEACKGLLVPVG